MKKELLMKQLKQFIDEHNYVMITIGSDRVETYGIPFYLSSKLVMILEFFDFMPNGYTILRLQDIKQVDYNDTCIYFENIVKKENALIYIENAPDISLKSWQFVFLSLKESNLIIIIDIGKEDCVILGKVVNAANSYVSMLCFSPTGIWDESELRESYKNITSVRFLNHYTNIYTKYLPETNQPQ